MSAGGESARNLGGKAVNVPAASSVVSAEAGNRPAAGPNRSQAMNEVFIPIIIAPTSMLVLGWIVRTISINRRLRETAKLQTEMQTKLLEKFGTSQDMLQFLASDAG